MSRPLAHLLRELIRLHGPLDVARFMALCAAHRDGYYERAETIGAAGDFVTAPEISQVFGELVGLALAAHWRALGCPRPVRLVDYGPGRGTLLVDLWRAAGTVPGFREAVVEVVTVERSRRLAALQRERLATLPLRPVRDPEEVPDDLPLFAVANEFFDALPVRQFVVTEAGVRERLVTFDETRGRFVFTLGRAVPREALRLPAAVREGMVGVSPAREAVAAGLAARLAAGGGLALVIDYGEKGGDFGDSLQAVSRHRRVDPLATPGEADISSLVDFAALARAAEEAGARAFGPLPQGAWLLRLGVRARLARLVAAAPGRRAELEAGVARLVDPAAMGERFKVLALGAPGDPPPPGFGGDERWSSG